MSLTRTKVEEISGTIDMAMSNLRDSMKKVPDTGLGLGSSHTRFTQSIATLKVLLDEAHRFSSDEDLFDSL